MSKTLLLTRSNLRKNRGTSVGLFLLMFIATCLIGISLLIFMDCYPSVSREAVRLNGGDGYISISGNLEGFTDEKITELIKEDTDRYYTYHVNPQALQGIFLPLLKQDTDRCAGSA